MTPRPTIKLNNGRYVKSTFENERFYFYNVRKEETAREWRNESTLFPWVAYQLSLRRPRKEIVAEARALYEKNPEKWGTRRGKPLTEALLSHYAKHCGLPKP